MSRLAPSKMLINVGWASSAVLNTFDSTAGKKMLSLRTGRAALPVCNALFAALAAGAAEHLHQLTNLLALIGLVAGLDSVFHATGNVSAQEFFLDARQGGANSRDLRHDVDAIAVFIDHFCKAANLTFNAVDAPFTAGLDVLKHGVYIPP
jgi:hypothetical protein